jgi:hypothetical protein
VRCARCSITPNPTACAQGWSVRCWRSATGGCGRCSRARGVRSPDAVAALLSLEREREPARGQWLLDWMEDAEPATFAAIARSLARLASEGRAACWTSSARCHAAGG